MGLSYVKNKTTLSKIHSGNSGQENRTDRRKMAQVTPDEISLRKVIAEEFRFLKDFFAGKYIE